MPILKDIRFRLFSSFVFIVFTFFATIIIFSISLIVLPKTKSEAAPAGCQMLWSGTSDWQTVNFPLAATGYYFTYGSSAPSGTHQVRFLPSAQVILYWTPNGAGWGPPYYVVQSTYNIPAGQNVQFTSSSYQYYHEVGACGPNYVDPKLITPINSTIRAYLSSNWSTNVNSTSQRGINNIGVTVSSNSNKVATFDVDFSAQRDWTNVYADSNSSTYKAVFGYTGGNFTNIPGRSSSTYTMYVPKWASGTKVGFCPNANTLAEIMPGCTGQVFIASGASGTVGGATVTVTAGTGTYAGYWAVSGLTVKMGAFDPADNSAPTTLVTITNPVYSPSTWNYSNTIKGTASDGSGLSSVQITIQRSSNSAYWTGSYWGSQTWLNVTSGLSSWIYYLNDENLDDAVTYTVNARGTDLVGNTTSSGFGTDTFIYSMVGGAPPSGLTLIDPTTSPNKDQTPTIRISGVTSGDTIYLYTDDCMSGLVGSVTATSDTVDITTSSLAEGLYTFKTNTKNLLGNYSSCSSESVSYEVALGNIIEIAPSPVVVPVLATDWSTNLTDTAQTGIIAVGVEDKTDLTSKIAVLNVDFVNVPVWTGVTGGTSETASFFHSSQSISTITNGAASSYSLYIKKGEGDKVWICPGAASLSQVTLHCSGGFFLSEGQTVNGATAAVEGIYWKVSGLTGTGGMSVITGLRDILSRLQVGLASNHTITFGTNSGLIIGTTDTMVITFPNFDLTEITLSDIQLTDNVGVLRNLASLPGANTWGLVIDAVAKTLTFSVPTSGTGGYLPATQIVINIGINAGGINQILNPISVGTSRISIILNNAAPGEMGELEIPLIDSDQVNITGYVTTYMNFDIDIATGELPGVDPVIDCNFNVCKTHENGNPGLNYTVDFGELTSAIVNKSNSISVDHTEGGTGIINSIYFDIGTNAPSGAVVTVKSANGGLQGPGTNKIPSIGVSVGADGITRSDGDDISANSGVYGYNLPIASSLLHGAIIPNSLCDTAIKFCGPETTPKTVFTTNNLPVDTARVRMDLAAAANYTNNPGLYTDTLTFTATATF